MATDGHVRDHWALRMRAFLPEFMREHPALSRVAAEAAVLLHGSTTRGVDDAFSDLDVWVLVPEAALPAIDAVSETRFFEFALDGKPGHFNVESRDEFVRRVRACDFPLIAELRSTVALADAEGWAGRLIEAACRPMPEAVRRAWFCYHYVTMRGAHRACDNPIERCDAVAVLQAMAQTLTEALCAAMVLDGEPYPYVKWLRCAATDTPTGRRVALKIDDLLDLLAQDALRLAVPERQHPLSDKLREIRTLLIEAARAQGLDEPWLDRWWLSMDKAQRGISEVRWSGPEPE